MNSGAAQRVNHHILHLTLTTTASSCLLSRGWAAKPGCEQQPPLQKLSKCWVQSFQSIPGLDYCFIPSSFPSALTVFHCDSGGRRIERLRSGLQRFLVCLRSDGSPFGASCHEARLINHSPPSDLIMIWHHCFNWSNSFSILSLNQEPEGGRARW